MAKGVLFASLAWAAIALATPVAAKTVNAVASFTILADVVKNIGGDHVNVKSLVPPNGDPHDYEPTPDDAKTLKTAELTFLSGEDLEHWFARLVKASGFNGTPVIVSDGIKTGKMVDDGKAVTDPHVWNSIPNVEIWVSNIEAALEKADPEDAADFKANAESYMKQLKDLDFYTRDQIKAVPEDGRKILTSHDAFGYFGREYGLTFLAPLGVSTETEASAAEVAKLIGQIKKEHVKVYFFENSNDPRLVKQVANATGAQPGGELYPEALSPPDGPASTYLKMFKYNVDQMVAAMNGS
jgi:zinc/manganese transport system substrate-binding protein